MLSNGLRGAVLQAAVQGRITSQSSCDSSIYDVMNKILERNEQELNESYINQLELFDLPSGWMFVQLKNIVSFFGGYAYKSNTYVSDSENLLIRLGNIKNDKILFNASPVYIDEKQAAITSKFEIKENDILFTMTGTRLKRDYFYTTLIKSEDLKMKKLYLNQRVGCLRSEPEINAQWLNIILKSKFLLDQVFQNETGTANQGNIGSKSTLDTIIPVPPIEEQSRIVVKVEKLMEKISEFEKIEIELETLNKEIPGKVKKSILQTSFQGKLTEQLDSDSSVDDTLKAIHAEKEELIKEKKIRKKKLNPIKEHELPFDIPENWRWARLGEIVYNWGQKSPDSDFCYIDVASIDNKNNSLGNVEKILKAKEAPSRARKIVKYGDIIYSTVRPYLHNICLINREFSKEPIASTAFAVMRTHNGILNTYLFKFLLSPVFDSYVNNSENSKGVAYPAINDERLYNALVPIPPIEEQYRIVERLEELLLFCEGLEKIEPIMKVDFNEFLN